MFLLFHGKDTYRSLLEARKKIEELKAASGNAEVTVLDADTSEPEKILNLLSTGDMFSSTRIVMLKRVFKNRNKEILIEALMETLPQQGIPDTIFWEDHKVNGITKYYKFFKKNDSLMEFDQMKKPGFVKWAMDEIEAKGIRGDRNLVYELAARVNFQAERLVNEVEKLFIAGIKALDRTVLKDTADTIEYDIWKLIDAVNENDQKVVLDIAENLMNQQQDPNYILAMLARNTKLLVEVKHLRENGAHTNEIASKLRIPPFTVPSLSSSAEKVSMERLKSIYEKLASLDHEIKRGSIDPQLGLTLLLTKL
jgi:DNA polymerase-3 subunit delta